MSCSDAGRALRRRGALQAQFNTTLPCGEPTHGARCSKIAPQLPRDAEVALSAQLLKL